MTKTIAFFQGFYLPYLGGVERYTHNIALKLMAKGHRVIIVTSLHDEKLKTKEVDGLLTIYRLPSHSFWKQRYPFLKKNRDYQALIEEIKKEDIDLYVANTRFQLPALLGARLATEAKKPVICIEHGTGYLTLNNALIDKILSFTERQLIKRIKRDVSDFYGVSQEATSWLKAFDIKGKGILYNAINAQEILTYPIEKSADKTIISYAGRLQPKLKGVETLLSAFEKMSQDFSQLELHIAGDGPILEDLKAKHQSASIVFHGKLSHEEVMTLDARSDIFVLMSKLEGFSTALLEAGLLQNLLISTDVGGAREMIPNDDYGYVIENSEEALMEVLRTVLSNKEQMRQTQLKISEHIKENFTWDQTALAFEKIIEEKTR
ncbi:glycosyltransferase family 4 protein [Lactococcus termiticola]|uniref:Glycosyl transferase n=1 Tax=Lactococcus termiticola TaxID=2169526 RepID=A0A2R5HGU5_9LACT|nr:glycosyltransferase family 4 protein [Lactococcus termiticola]GBG97259.1 glycosyl transferase [Lactococcus termiticola]